MLCQGGQDLLQEGLRQVSEPVIVKSRRQRSGALLRFRQIRVNPLPPLCFAAYNHRGEIPMKEEKIKHFVETMKHGYIPFQPFGRGNAHNFPLAG